MNDSESRYEDLERTDVLPQLALKSDQDNNIDNTARLAHSPGSSEPQSNESRLSEHAAKPFGIAAHASSANGRVTALPAKPSTTDLAVGGIRGKITDLENRLIEAQDRHIDLNHQCEQLTRRCGVAEERATKAEANYVQQASDLHRVELRAVEAQQRLQEERVRFEARVVEAERQLVDTRTRGEKRVSSLEQILEDQTERAALSDKAASEASVELEKARGELHIAQTSIRGLEERLAEQSRAAAEVTKLYSQQTTQVAANAAFITDIENTLADVQAEKIACDGQIAKLETQVHFANEVVTTLRSEIAMKLRHVAALEQGLLSREATIETLEAKLTGNEHSAADLMAAKAEVEQRCAELEKATAAAKAVSSTAEQEIARLNTALRGNDVRINELSAALRTAELSLKERDAAIAEVADRADTTRSEYAQVVERTDALRRRLDENEQQTDALQAQLAARTAELNAAQESARTSQTQQSEIAAAMRKLETEFAETRQAMGAIMAERNQLETENQAGREELSLIQTYYQEAAQTVVATRESIAVRDQKNSSLERELRAATQRLAEANERIERAAATAEEFNAELRRRDNRIAVLEQKCEEHASALSSISQDIERVNSANPSERLAAMGYALEALDQTGTIHRISRTTTTVGRVASNNVAIDSTSVSRYHARIVVQPEGVWLIDLQSTNGCGVNGRRVSRQILCEGDTVMIGHCKFRFLVHAAAEEAQAPDQAFPLFEEPLLIPKPRAANQEAPREQHH